MPDSARAAKQRPKRPDSPRSAKKRPDSPRSKRSPTKSPSKKAGKLKLPAGFKDLGPIAAGAFSTITKARHIESGAEVAVKCLKCASEAEAASCANELEVLRIVSAAGHAHIANMLDEEAVEGGVLAYLQYCGGGSLHAHLAKLRKKQAAMNESDGVVLAAQIASALQHCHALGVCHRDVKPANVLFDGRRWRLCDFGFAAIAGDRKLRDQLGSIVYAAPEILNGKSGYIGWAVDMWALGAMLYEVRMNRTCFIAADEPTLRLRIAKGFKGGSDGFPWGPRMSLECRAVISALMVKAPEERLSAQRLLEHDWISEHCTPVGFSAAGLEARDTPDGDGAAAALADDPGDAVDLSVDDSASGAADDDGGDGAATAQEPHWWCDVAAAGCLRPEQPTHEGQYDPDHRCWAHPNGEYMVCERCYASGCAEHTDVLRLLESFRVLDMGDGREAGT